MNAPNDPNLTALTATADPTCPTDADPTLQNVTKCYANRENALPSLTRTPRQLTAISLLCAGLHLEVVAARLGISRMTLYRWRHTHPAFVAELSRRPPALQDPRLVGTQRSSPENHPTPETTPAADQNVDFPEDSANSPPRQ